MRKTLEKGGETRKIKKEKNEVSVEKFERISSNH